MECKRVENMWVGNRLQNMASIQAVFFPGSVSYKLFKNLNKTLNSIGNRGWKTCTLLIQVL